MAGSRPARRRRPRPVRTYRAPRVSLLYVLRRTGHRLLDIQVWDVAGAMTFFALLSLLPAMVALVSLVSLLGLEEETVAAAAGLAHEIWPALTAAQVESWILGLGQTATGTTAVVLGALGAMFSASGAVAAFHRALHRIHDTREGRPLLWFRAVVFVETALLMAGLILLLLLVVLGGDLSRRLGMLLGLTETAVAAWNLGKWAVILAILMIVVATAYYWGPNVRKPRYRPLSVGAMTVVALLFAATLGLGWIVDNLGQFELVGRLNSAISVLVLVWLAFIVLVAGAALDAEVLRARQLAAGVDAAEELQLASQHVAVLRTTERQEERNRRVGRIVARAARTGEPAQVPRTRLLAEAGSLFAVGDAGRTADQLSTGRPFHADQEPEPTDEIPDPGREPAVAGDDDAATRPGHRSEDSPSRPGRVNDRSVGD